MSFVTSLKTKVDLDSRSNHNQYNMSAMKSNRKYYYCSGLRTFFIVTHHKKSIMEQTRRKTHNQNKFHKARLTPPKSMHSDIFLFGFILVFFYAI